MPDPTTAARVAELRGVGVPTGDAIGQAAAERAQRDNPPPWLADLPADSAPLVEHDNPEGDTR